MEQIGYSIVDAQGNEVQTWGDLAGACPAIPEFIDWPSGARTYCPSLGMEVGGAQFVARLLDQSVGASPSEAKSFDGTSLIVTRVVVVTKDNLKAYAAGKRYAVEVGGIVVGGAPIPTDRDTQAKLSGAWAAFQAGALTGSVQWKTPAGWIALDQAAVTAVASAVAQHVQAAFATEQAVDAGIDTEAITTTAAIDVAAWPTNS